MWGSRELPEGARQPEAAGELTLEQRPEGRRKLLGRVCRNFRRRKGKGIIVPGECMAL